MEENTQKSIGKYLKSIREEKNLMLREISGKTCISEEYLKKIESDNFEDMGGLGYAKAITSTYAKALGANDKLVLHLFNNIYSKPQEKSYYRKKNLPRKFMIPTSAFSILLLIIIVIVLTLVIVRLYKNDQLNFPFRHKTEKVEKAKILEEPVNNHNEILEADAKENKAVDLSDVKAVKIDISAIQDTTDYTDKYLFKGKDSPFNVKE